MSELRCVIVALLLTFVSASRAAAQELPTSFYQMQVLVKIGDVVDVTDASGHEVRGTVAGLTRSTLALSVDGARRDWTETDITMIRQRRPDPLANGVLWGFGIGAGLGVASLLGGGCEGSVTFLPVCMGIAGAFGAGIGAAVDAAIRREQVIFTRPLAVTGVRFEPFLTSSRRGVLVAVQLTRER